MRTTLTIFLTFHYFIYFNCEKLCERSLMAMLLEDNCTEYSLSQYEKLLTSIHFDL